MAVALVQGETTMVSSQNGWVTRVAAIVVAIVVNIIVLYIARGVGANVRAEGPGYGDPTKIVPANVVWGSLSWSISALIVFLLINRFASKPSRMWWIAAAVGLLVSFYFPLAQGVGTGTIVTFVIMHLIAAGLIVPAFAATISRR